MKRFRTIVFATILAITGTLATHAQSTSTQIHYSETTTIPGGTIQTPFGPKEAPASSSSVEKTITLDEANRSAFAALCQNVPAPAPSHLAAAELAKEYTPAELTAALTAALSK